MSRQANLTELHLMCLFFHLNLIKAQIIPNLLFIVEHYNKTLVHIWRSVFFFSSPVFGGTA